MNRFHLLLLIIFLSVLFALRLGFYFSKANDQILPKNQPIKFEATVKAEPKIYDTGQVISVGGAKLYVDLYPKYSVGDRLLVEGNVDNKGRIFRAKVEKIGKRGGVSTFLASLRNRISEKIFAVLPGDEAVLVAGSVLGVDRINTTFRDKLIKTGTIHVVVVSGQNLSIVALVFLSMGRFVGRRKSLLLASVAVVLYAALTGFEPPVVRASLMVLTSAVAIYLGRENIAIWSLFLAAAAIVLVNPAALFEVSFQLTFAATLGIMTLGNKISNFKFPISNFLAIPLSAYIFTAPVILYYFGAVSPIAPLANIFVIEAVAPIMALGFLIALASLVFMPLAQILAYLAFVPAAYFVKVVQVFAAVPLPLIEIGKGSWLFVLGYFVLLLGVMAIIKGAKARP